MMCMGRVLLGGKILCVFWLPKAADLTYHMLPGWKAPGMDRHKEEKKS